MDYENKPAKFATFQDMSLCDTAQTYQGCGVTCFIHLQRRRMQNVMRIISTIMSTSNVERANYSESLAYFIQTAQKHILEDTIFPSFIHDNFKSNTIHTEPFRLGMVFNVALLLNLQAPQFLYIGQAFRFSPENAFYIFNQQIYFII